MKVIIYYNHLLVNIYLVVLAENTVNLLSLCGKATSGITYVAVYRLVLRCTCAQSLEELKKV